MKDFYKKNIIKIIRKIDNEYWLGQIYYFMLGVLKL